MRFPFSQLWKLKLEQLNDLAKVIQEAGAVFSHSIAHVLLNISCWLPMNEFSDDNERINIKRQRNEEHVVQVQICYCALHGILWFHCILSMELFLTQLCDLHPLLSSQPGLSNSLLHILPAVLVL